MATGWLVNDCLTCIPGTKTFWHDLLEWIPGLVDKTNGFTSFVRLARRIEEEAQSRMPDYIIRNATFFGRINLTCKQISLLQDYYEGNAQQVDVCNHSAVTVFNSNYTFSKYRDLITTCRTEIIPLGVDFDLFKPTGERHPGVLPNSILFVGAANNYPKGFDVIRNLIDTTDYNFCLVMKDDFRMSHPRVKVFNKVGHDELVKIYNSCEMVICSSVVETLHLVSIEAGACGLPIITTNVGGLCGVPSSVWGLKVIDGNYVECIEQIRNNRSLFSPREFLLKLGFDKDTCKERWLKLINEEIL